MERESEEQVLINKELNQVDITTKTGDNGTSSMYNGKRALGSLDECNSFIGLAREFIQTSCSNVDTYLEVAQCVIFDVSAAVATPLTTSKEKVIEKTLFDASHVKSLESMCFVLNQELPYQDSFILPSGGKAASFLHVARSVCRRAERSMVPLLTNNDISQETFVYINRLSDFLYLAARYVSMKENNPPKKWKKI